MEFKKKITLTFDPTKFSTLGQLLMVLNQDDDSDQPESIVTYEASSSKKEQYEVHEEHSDMRWLCRYGQKCTKQPFCCDFCHTEPRVKCHNKFFCINEKCPFGHPNRKKKYESLTPQFCYNEECTNQYCPHVHAYCAQPKWCMKIKCDGPMGTPKCTFAHRSLAILAGELAIKDTYDAKKQPLNGKDEDDAKKQALNGKDEEIDD